MRSPCRMMIFLTSILCVGSLGAQISGSASKPALFIESDQCIACHNGLVAPDGRDVSIGTSWESSMMAHSSRDPYWQAAVRREVTDHPMAKEAIEHECAACHMPMTRYEAKVSGEKLSVFPHVPTRGVLSRSHRLAADGVSCAMCHQIQEDKLGTRESFTAGFVVSTQEATAQQPREIFGPYEVDAGRQEIMRSSTDFVPSQSTHVQSSEFCASCHTLITHALDDAGNVIGELPEQVPYLEWRHSSYAENQSCQSCHMPIVDEPMAVSSVLGVPREGFSRHAFRGGNFFMLRLHNRYRDELAVQASTQQIDSAVRETLEHLSTESARLVLESASWSQGTLEVALRITNLAGHKLPTAYPSRRAWIHLKVEDEKGRVLFESGKLREDGSIEGNDNDHDAETYEAHYETIRSPEEVQIYEAVMVDPEDRVTTGLLTALRFIKDNRLLPRGFEKETASEDVAVRGPAAEDTNFLGSGDRLNYQVPLDSEATELKVTAELWYQPISYRWARNLEEYSSEEPQKFVEYYDSMAKVSGTVLAQVERAVRPTR